MRGYQQEYIIIDMEVFHRKITVCYTTTIDSRKKWFAQVMVDMRMEHNIKEKLSRNYLQDGCIGLCPTTKET